MVFRAGKYCFIQQDLFQFTIAVCERKLNVMPYSKGNIKIELIPGLYCPYLVFDQIELNDVSK